MSEARYRGAIRAAFRGLWSGALDYDQAFDAMMSAIRTGISRAWTQGAGECGIRPDEFTPEERVARERFIFEQFGHIGKALNWVEQNKRGSGGVRLGQKQGSSSIYSRVELWVNKYRAAAGQAGAMACANRKKKFLLGRTEKHCTSCSGLNRRVYRYNTWLENDAIPPSRCFSCGGWRCLCQLVDTDEPITRGRFPKSLIQC